MSASSSFAVNYYQPMTEPSCSAAGHANNLHNGPMNLTLHMANAAYFLSLFKTNKHSEIFDLEI